jgi:methionine aminopeptidase
VFGKAGRVKAQDFGGCCEPKNLRVLANGDILAAESGPPTCIKRFSASGKFLGVVAVADGARGDCVRVTVAMSPEQDRYYLLDTTRDAIRVFAAKR